MITTGSLVALGSTVYTDPRRASCVGWNYPNVRQIYHPNMSNAHTAEQANIKAKFSARERRHHKMNLCKQKATDFVNVDINCDAEMQLTLWQDGLDQHMNNLF